MIEFTSEAQQIHDDYVKQVRAYAAACKSADAEEVLRDLGEHIANELAGAERPVTAEALSEVLRRLGEPRQWVPDEELSWWRKVVLRMRVGPEDWRLAYGTFGLLLWGALFGWIFNNTYTYGHRYIRHDFNWEAFVIFAAGSFIVARAGIAYVEDTRRLNPGQKWLIYPSLVFVYVPLLAGLLSWAAFAGGVVPVAFGIAQRREPDFFGLPWDLLGDPFKVGYRDHLAGVLAGCAGAFATGLWWLIMGLVFALRPAVPRAIFRPFADGFKPKWGVWFIILGLVFMILGGGAAVWVFQGGGAAG